LQSGCGRCMDGAGTSIHASALREQRTHSLNTPAVAGKRAITLFAPHYSRCGFRLYRFPGAITAIWRAFQAATIGLPLVASHGDRVRCWKGSGGRSRRARPTHDHVFDAARRKASSLPIGLLPPLPRALGGIREIEGVPPGGLADRSIDDRFRGGGAGRCRLFRVWLPRFMRPTIGGLL
jgi:hypothetical protein